MDLVSLLAWVGASISLIGTGRYIAGILHDGTQPRLASWIAWLAANIVLAVVAVLAGAYLAAIFNSLAALGNGGVLVAAAIKRAGVRPTGQSDWGCLSAAGVCLVVILVFPHLSLLGALLAMSANIIATWPTAQNAWGRPFAETWHLFAANAGASLLGLISVAASTGNLKFTVIAGPLIAMIGNLALTIITLVRRSLHQVAETIQEEMAEIEQVILPTNLRSRRVRMVDSIQPRRAVHKHRAATH
jgi:hypothetical protein